VNKKTYDSSYLEVIAVSIDGGSLRVTFANLDVIDLPTSKIVPPRARISIHWHAARIIAYGTSILVPAEPSDLEIPAEVIRQLSDTDFANHLARLAEEQARLIGPRLRQLRESRGLTQADVARLANLQPANLSRIESGRYDVASSTLWKILSALRCSVAELAAPAFTRLAPPVSVRVTRPPFSVEDKGDTNESTYSNVPQSSRPRPERKHYR
jgi:transcriptional regulator with XRE-family HTH domain